MALMERVATLLRANINDLVARAEDPEKMLRQLLLDMENQLLQVKTQVAMALAHQHVLERKAQEQEQAAAAWHRKAELAISKGDESLARAALERAVTHETTLDAYRRQVTEQRAEAEAIRATFSKLQAKLAETRTRCDLLIAQHRRLRLISRANEASATATDAAADGTNGAATARAKPAHPADADRATDGGNVLLQEDSLEDRFAALEREDRVEQLLAELKGKQQRLLPTG